MQHSNDGGGWSVSSSLLPATKPAAGPPPPPPPPMTSPSAVRSPGDGVGDQSMPGNGTGNNGFQFSPGSYLDSVPVKRGQHFYELQRSVFENKQTNPAGQKAKSISFKSNSQEELDKLLEGLDKLTENLPDLKDVRSFSSLAGFSESPSNGSSFSNSFANKPEVFKITPGSIGLDKQNSLIRPSIVAKHSSGALQSRDTYDSGQVQDTMTTLTTSQPYHTRSDSKPFSYIRSNASGSSRGTSRNISRASSREGLSQPGLESPGILRKIMGGGTGTGTDSESGSRPMSPSFSYGNNHHQRNVSDLSSNIYANQIYSTPRSPVPVQSSSLIGDMSHMSDEEASLTWLQKQQRKLQERREAQRCRVQSGGSVSTATHEGDLIRELKTSLSRARSEMSQYQDGYLSDNTSFRFSENSRENSPGKNPTMKTSASTTWQQQHQQTVPKYSNNQDDSGQLKLSNYQQQQQQLLLQQQQQQQQLQQNLSRQKSDSSYDRSRPLISRRLRYDSESEDQTKSVRPQKPSNGSSSMYASNHSIDSFQTQTDFYSQPGSRPITPGFPNLPATPLFNSQAGYSRSGSLPQKYMMLSNGDHMTTPLRSESPAFSTYQVNAGTSRRASVSSEPADVSPQSVKLVKDSHKFWYKPHISREDAIGMLRHRPAGTFVVRDSNSFPGAFGLALKVSTPPTAPVTRSDPPGDELIRHFLIEPTSKGVKLKGYSNEPVFGSLSALVYQHTLTPLALPTKLTLPSSDLAAGGRDSVDSKTSSASQMQILLSLGAACNVFYLFSLETDSLTGPLAIKKAVGLMLSTQPTPTLVHFKVSSQGITLTDNTRKLFFRKHYNTNTISYCAVDPDDRKWTAPKKSGSDSKSSALDACRIFGFVARNPNSRSSNQCHIFAEEDPDQPARAIVNFVNKVLLNTTSTTRSEVV